MPRTRLIQHAFNSGEWSPLLEGRSDLQKYANAVRMMRNCFCLKHGGATRRPGTRFVKEVKYSDKTTHLIRFEFSTVQAYIIEAGELYFRFYANSGNIESSPGVPLEISTPYLASEVDQLVFTQSADVLYIVHPNHPPMKLERLSSLSWTLTAIPFTGGPFIDGNAAITITAGATTGAGITLVASAPLFAATDVGSLWRIMGTAVWGIVRIVTVTDNENATADVIVDLDSVGPSIDQAAGAWSATRGYPCAITLFQQRLWLGGTSNQPDTFWGSQTSDYENFAPGTGADDEACTFTLASNRVNAIRWMAPSRALLIGTTGQEWQATGGDVTVPITPANITAKPETPHGSGTVQPVQVQNVTLFIQKAGRKLREFSFDFASDSYLAPDVSVLAEHITEGGIIDIDYQQELDSLVWMVRSDGSLIGMTYERAQDVVGWHRHTTGFGGDPRDGKFESVAVIPHPDGDQDQVWCVVNRTFGGIWTEFGNFGGVTRRYVEYLDNKGGYYGPLNVDSGLTYSGVATATLSGLSHLEGQTVDIVGNGAVYPAQVVASGQVTGLSPTVTSAEVGLHYDSEIVTMRPEGGAASGTAQGARKRFNQIFVRLYKSIGVSINGDIVPFRSTSDPMNQAIDPFTGDKDLTTMEWGRDAFITIEQNQPLPFTVLAIFGVIEVND